MFGQFSGQQQTHGGLDLSRCDGGALVVVRETRRDETRRDDALEDVVDERVHDLKLLGLHFKHDISSSWFLRAAGNQRKYVHYHHLLLRSEEQSLYSIYQSRLSNKIIEGFTIYFT